MPSLSAEAIRPLLEQLAPHHRPDILSERIFSRAADRQDRLRDHLTEIAHAANIRSTLEDAIPALLVAAADSYDPAMALASLASLSATEFPWDLAGEHPESLCALLAGSTYLTDLFAARTDRFDWLVDAIARPWTQAELLHDMESELAAAGVSHEGLPQGWAALRRWHGLHLLRIGWADISGTLDIRQIADELATIAATIIDTVAHVHAAETAARFGEPIQADGRPARWCVIGLGKLGGGELNFRSDIDLMFVYSEDGASGGGRSEGITLNEWYSRWAERVIATIGEVSPAGTLYRVDTRLRPDGSSGALTRSLSSYLHYYETRGEVWERQMLVKARPVAGDHSLGDALTGRLEPYIFPRTLTLSPRQEIRRVKSRILAHLAARDATLNSSQVESNLKLRRGGLRDIEFIVQCLQLVAGGAERSIRSTNTLDAIDSMRDGGVLTPEEADNLERSYRLYRRVEHRLQMASGIPTFDLPSEQAARLRLARRMGFENVDAFLDELSQVREHVSAIYDEVLGPPDALDDMTVLLELEPGGRRVAELLSPYGFRDADRAHASLRLLAFGHDAALAPTGPRQAVVRLVPRLLEQLRESADPDRALTNIEQVLGALGAVESFSDLLASHPKFLELLVTLCAGSQSLTDTVLRHPALIDWMLYGGVLLKDRDLDELGLVLRASVAGLSESKDVDRAVHAFRKQETLRIGLRYLLGLSDDHETGCQLAAVADAVLCLLHQRATKDVYARRGRPLDGDGEPTGLCVLALGKLGSREMNFGSDLDLVFVHGAEGKTDTGGDNITVFTTVAQRIMRDISEVSSHGLLYEVDARLRPEGHSGPLTISLNGYRHYLEHRAGTWERQALTRARVISGPTGLRDEVSSVIDAYVYAALDGEASMALIDEVVAMRARMQDAAAEKYPGQMNIKTGPGGLVDAEFTAQLGQILYAGRDMELRGLDTVEALQRLERSGLLPGAEAGVLVAAYRELRILQMSLRIKDEHAHNVLPDDEEGREVLARGLGSESAEELLATLNGTTAGMRRAYEAAMDSFRNQARARG